MKIYGYMCSNKIQHANLTYIVLLYKQKGNFFQDKLKTNETVKEQNDSNVKITLIP